MNDPVKDLLAAQHRIRDDFRTGKRQRARLAGHKLTMEWNGEYGWESASTGTCPCGWQESASSKNEVRNEYFWHITREMARAEMEKRNA